jgi:hypothetical protein
VDIDPATALLWCVTLTAQKVHWLDAQIGALEEAGIPAYGRPVKITKKEVTVAVGGNSGSELVPTTVEEYDHEQIHFLIKERDIAVEYLARYSKMAIDAGIAERIVHMAEQLADLLAPFLEGIFDDEELALTAKQRKALPAVTGRHLKALEGGRAA